MAQDPVYLALGTESLAILQDPQQLNSYSYTRNNPVQFIDPLGESISVYMEQGSVGDGMKAVYGHTFLDINGTVYSWGGGDDLGNFDLHTGSTSDFLNLNGKNSDSYSVYTFDTSTEQEESVKGYYQGLIDNFHATPYGGDPNRIAFSPLSYNCTDVVVEALQSGGLLSESFDLPFISTPGNLKARLDQKYESQQEGGFFHEISNWLNRGKNSQISDISTREVLETDK